MRYTRRHVALPKTSRRPSQCLGLARLLQLPRLERWRSFASRLPDRGRRCAARAPLRGLRPLARARAGHCQEPRRAPRLRHRHAVCYRRPDGIGPPGSVQNVSLSAAPPFTCGAASPLRLSGEHALPHCFPPCSSGQAGVTYPPRSAAPLPHLDRQRGALHRRPTIAGRSLLSCRRACAHAAREAGCRTPRGLTGSSGA